MTPSDNPAWPDEIHNEEELDDLLTRPSEALIHFMRTLDGDLMVLGVADHWTRGPRPTVDLAGGTLSSIAGTVGFLLVIVSLTAHIGVWWALLLGLAVIPVLNRAVPALSARMPELTWRRAFSGGRLAQAPIR